MSHPARGPNALGIDGKAIAAGRRLPAASRLDDGGGGGGMSHPARGPNVLGIDGKAIAAGRQGMSGRFRATMAVAMAVFALAACKHQVAPVEMEVRPVEGPKAQAAAKPATCEPKRIEVRTDVDNLMSLYGTLRSMTPSALKQEFETARREFNTYGSEVSRLTLAMLYLLPNAPFRNEAQAAQLLEPYQKGDGRSKTELRGLGQLLAGQVEAWRRNEAAIVAQNTKLKDEQRRTEELQRKLDALKDVERAMIQKDQGAKPK